MGRGLRSGRKSDWKTGVKGVDVGHIYDLGKSLGARRFDRQCANVFLPVDDLCVRVGEVLV